MRRLEHLPGIERVKVGVVVAEPEGYVGQDFLDCRLIGCGLRSRIVGREGRELGFKELCGAGE
jgi:hypothetical protein